MTVERRQERQEKEGNGVCVGGVDTWKEPRAQRQWTKWRVGTGLGNTNGF